MNPRILLTDSGDALQVNSMERTEDGFLEVWGVAATTGVYEYPEDDDRRDLVTPRALGSEKSIESLKKASVVLEHPDEKQVNPKNNQREQVGEVLDVEFDKDTGRQIVHLLIKVDEAIEAIESEWKTGLSPGYDPDIDESSGEHDKFGPYDRKQVNRRNNHLAITSTPRGEDETKLHVDSLPFQTDDQSMDEEVKDALDALQDRLDSLEDEVSSGSESDSEVDMDKLMKMVKKMFDDMYGESDEPDESSGGEDAEADEGGAPEDDKMDAESVSDAVATWRKVDDFGLDDVSPEDTTLTDAKRKCVESSDLELDEEDDLDTAFKFAHRGLEDAPSKSSDAESLEDSFNPSNRSSDSDDDLDLSDKSSNWI